MSFCVNVKGKSDSEKNQLAKHHALLIFGNVTRAVSTLMFEVEIHKGII